MNEFIIYNLGDVAKIFAGGDKPKLLSEFKTNECEIPVFANGETKDGLQGYTDKAKVTEPAVTVSARGTIGYAVLRKEPFVPIVRLLTLIPNKKILDVYYLYYYLTLYRQKGIGSSQAQLITPDLSKRTISIPPLPTQKSIAKVLSDLDAKIELNNKINQELEAMAKTLYDYWFVQFDFPTPPSSTSGIVGKPYKSSGGKMVYNAELKREIPEGWEVKELGELGEFKNGVNYNPSNPGEIACPIINVRNISASSFFVQNEDLDIIYLSESDVRNYSVSEESIIIARSGIPGATRLISDIAKNTLYCGFAIQYELINLRNKIPIFFFLKSLEEHIKSGSGGTILKNVNQGILKALLICLPNNEELLIKFNRLIEPIFDKINNLKKQNQQLSSLRDWLLPMLMNGQVASRASATAK